MNRKETFNNTQTHTDMKPLSYSDAPTDWAVCLQDDCPLAQNCLRRTIGRMMPEGTLQHAIVLPAAREGDRCRLFAQAEPVQIAHGMSHLLDGLPSGLASTLRHRLYDIFGSKPQFYRFREGRYAISPEQQARVAALFTEYGITAKPQYDSTTEEFYFPHP
ncbi:MAG: hypothetical protein IJ219_07855 [Bacteroidaceae bacterium]|nr:hypothetical protein [Bacteroidaceae bacterium]